MQNALLVKLQTVPLLQDVEDCNREGETHRKIGEYALPQAFQIANLRQQRKHGFDQHSLVSLSALAHFHIRRIFVFGAKAIVHVNDHPSVKLLDQRVKRGVRDIRRRRVSRDESELVGNDAEFAAHDPAPITQALFGKAASFRLAAFSDRMTQLNAERISHAKNARLSQKTVGQATVRLQAAKQARALGQSGKQRREVLREPPVKSVLRRALERKQQADCRKLAFTEFSFRMFCFAFHSLIYAAKQVYNKFFVSHGFDLVSGLVSFTIERKS